MPACFHSRGFQSLAQCTSVLGFLVCLLLIALPLSAQVISTSSAFILNPNAVALGSSGQFPPIVITVAAGTTLASNIQVLTLGAPNRDFTLVPSGTTCPTLTAVAGTTNSTCTVLVQFAPTVPGRRLGALVLTDQSGNTYDFSLDAQGIAPLAAFGQPDISTVAGTPGTAGSTGDNGQATSATLGGPKGVAFDGFGNM